MLSKINENVIKEAIENMINDDEGCINIILDYDLVLAVGYSAGYDENDDDCIHANDDKSYCLNIGIKIRNDFDCSDYDYLNFPWFENGEVYDCGIAYNPNIDSYKLMADYFKREYINIRKAINDGDLIIK